MATSLITRLKKRASWIFFTQPEQELSTLENTGETQPAPALERYKLYIDLYKFYLDLAVKVVTVYYAGLGVFLTYFFSQFDPSNKRTTLLLGVPIILGALLGEFFDRLYHKSEVFHREASKLKKSLQIEVGPEVMFWQGSIKISIFLFFLPSSILLVILVVRLLR